jgi:hypothetical protein
MEVNNPTSPALSTVSVTHKPEAFVISVTENNKRKIKNNR